MRIHRKKSQRWSISNSSLPGVVFAGQRAKPSNKNSVSDSSVYSTVLPGWQKKKQSFFYRYRQCFLFTSENVVFMTSFLFLFLSNLYFHLFCVRHIRWPTPGTSEDRPDVPAVMPLILGFQAALNLVGCRKTAPRATSVLCALEAGDRRANQLWQG